MLTKRECNDALVLAAATLVVQPLIPDRHIGLFEAINPRTTWTIVVLMLGIGAAGHIVVRCGRRDVSVGTGMDDATRQSLLANRSQLIGQTAEVDFQMRTPKGSLRHPVFVRVRGDK